VRVCVRVRARACVRVRARACVRVRARACVRARRFKLNIAADWLQVLCH